MAATNFTPVQLYHSTTAAAAPTAGNLANGELAININDGKLYYKDSGGVVQVIATKGAGTIGGSNTQIQYNNAGALAGNAAMTFNSGTNTVTLTTLNLTNALGAIYGGTSQSAYAQGDILYSSATNTLAKLGIGSANFILTSTGSVPQWTAPSSIVVQTATNLAGGAAGSVPYQSALDTTTFLAIGAANRVMTSTGSAPQWVTSLSGLTGVSSSSITNTSLTSGRVVLSTAGGQQTDDADLTFDGTTLSAGGLSTTGFSTQVKTVTLGNSNFNGVAVFAPSTPAKLYIGTGVVTDVTSAAAATNTTGAIASLAITPIAATNANVTYTNAATLYIAGAPSASTNVTITNPYSLYIAAGANYFGGAATFNSATTFATDITVYGLTVGRGAGAVSTNTAVGASALAANVSGTQITAVGYQAARNTTGVNVAAFGSNSGFSNTTGTLNAFFGTNSGYSNTTGSSNTAIGEQALFLNTTASANTAVGYQSMYSTQTGGTHAALGYQALYSVTQGVAGCSAFGYQAGYATTTGNVTAFGAVALASNTTGASNVAVGNSALYASTTGSNNVAVGDASLRFNTTASGNTAVGFQAAYRNTTGLSIVANGLYALFENTTGSYNTALGAGSLQSNTTASNNTAVGYQAGYSNTTGAGNVYVGRLAGYVATSSTNTFVGEQTGYNNTTGERNTYIGNSVGYNATTGSNNTFIGLSATSASGAAITTGSKNTILGGYNGNQGGLDIRTANNHIVLSDGDGNPRAIADSAGNWGLGGAAPSGQRLYVTGGQIWHQQNQYNVAPGSGVDYEFVNRSGRGWLFYTNDANNFGANITQFGLGLGNTVSGSGMGIAFPATQNASSNANTLDDYEEGTWSPVIQSDSTGNFTMTVQYGRYTKIGRVVTIQAFIQWSARPSGGNVTLTNMPFAINSGGTTGGNAATAFQVLSATDTALLNNNLSFDGTSDSNTIYAYNFARSALTAVNSLSSAGFIAYSGTYYVS